MDGPGRSRDVAEGVDAYPAGLLLSEDEDEGRCRALACVLKPDVRAELGKWFEVAWPVSVTLACQVAMTVTDVSFLGHIDTDYLAASSLASVWITIITIALWSFGDAVRVLCSQARGAGNSRLLGLWLQCGTFWISVLCIPVGALFLVTGRVLDLVRIEPKLCDLAQTFAYYSLIWLWPRALFNAFNSYLQSQNIVHPQMLASLVFVGVNVGLNYIFVHGGVLGWKGLGFIGSPIATACSQSLLTASILVYILAAKLYKPTWPGWTRESISKARSAEYLRQAIPVTIGRLIEELQIQVITIFAGHLGSVSVATHSGMLNIFFWLTTAMYGLMQATTVRVGMHLGNGDIKKARLMSRISFWMSLAIGAVVASVLMGARSELGKIYSSDPEVWKETGKISYLVGGGYLCLTVFFSSFAILEAQARPTIVAVAFFVGAWGVSVPLSYVFCFVLHQDLMGLWYGMSCGYLVVTAVGGVAVVRSNWEQIMEAAVRRSRTAPAVSTESAVAIPSINEAHEDIVVAALDEKTPLLFAPLPGSVMSSKRTTPPGFEEDE